MSACIGRCGTKVVVEYSATSSTEYVNRDVLRLVGRLSIEGFDGRTALLAGLVAELTEVTRAVKVKNPIIGQLNSLAGITERALDLMKAEKAANPV